MRFGQHEASGAHEGIGSSAFHQVAGEGEGPSCKTDERDVQFPAQDTNGFENVIQAFLGVDDAKAVHVVLAANGFEHGSIVFGEVNGYAHGFEGQEDIGEDDGGIDAQAQGLEGDLHGKFRGFAQLQHGVFRAQFAIFGHISSGLAHEPHRSAVNGLTAASA